MRLRERACVSAALAQGALIRCRRNLGLDLLNLLIHHKSCAWREMPSRWIRRRKSARRTPVDFPENAKVMQAKAGSVTPATSLCTT